jgi:acyl carrier protein
MNETVTYEEFVRMILDHFGLEQEKITRDTSFLDDLGVDSLSLVDFIVRLDKKYGIRIEMDGVFSLKNVGEAYALLVRKLEERSSVTPKGNGERVA